MNFIVLEPATMNFFLFNETHTKFKRILKVLRSQKNIDLRPVSEHESTEGSKFTFLR